MSHVAFVPFTGLRVRDRQMLELGMSMPGLQNRKAALGRLPALGVLTLAGMLPAGWTCSYHSIDASDEATAQAILDESPTLVAVSALTASIEGVSVSIVDRPEIETQTGADGRFVFHARPLQATETIVVRFQKENTATTRALSVIEGRSHDIGTIVLPI